MKPNLFTVVLALFATWPGTGSAAPERMVTIPTRPGVTISFVVVEPSGTPAAAVILFSGGHAEDDDPCRAMTRHGFLGIEKKVVDVIAEWIKAAK